jgi:hypothetical protein
VTALSVTLAAVRPAVKASTDSAWVAPTIVISILALGVSLATFFLSGRRARLDRQRQVFADALDAVTRYREYPFIVYRRNADDEARERQRISSDLSSLQAQLNGFKGRLRVEDAAIGTRYVELVDATRHIVGPMITEAWNRPPATVDAQVHNPGWDFSKLDSYDEAYLRAVADHLHWLPTPVVRTLHGWFGGRQETTSEPEA